MTSTPANAEGITVPSLVMTMGCHYLVVPGEIIYDHLAAKDKTYATVEGATHGLHALQAAVRRHGQAHLRLRRRLAGEARPLLTRDTSPRLNTLPTFSGSRGQMSNPNTGNASQSGGGNSAGSFLNLRNMGAVRTLILFDGHRVPPTNVTGSSTRT